MPGGRTRGGGRPWRDWLRRALTPEHRDPEAAASSDPRAAAPSPGGGDDVDRRASFDQVLRDAAAARGGPRHGDA